MCMVTPYGEIRRFWEALFDSGYLSRQNIILGGDLNLTLNLKEIWGEAARSDPLGNFFSQCFENAHLVDVEPVKLCK